MQGEVAEEFSRHYSAREQALMLKLMRAMLFANYCGNRYYKRPWRSGGFTYSFDVRFDSTDNKFKGLS